MAEKSINGQPESEAFCKMEELKDRITIRLGALKGPLASRARNAGQTPSEYIRATLATALGVEEPKLAVGNPNFGKKKRGK